MTYFPRISTGTGPFRWPGERRLWQEAQDSADAMLKAARQAQELGAAGEGTADEGHAGQGTAGQGTAGQGTAGQGAAGEKLASTHGEIEHKLRNVQGKLVGMLKAGRAGGAGGAESEREAARRVAATAAEDRRAEAANRALVALQEGERTAAAAVEAGVRAEHSTEAERTAAAERTVEALLAAAKAQAEAAEQGGIDVNIDLEPLTFRPGSLRFSSTLMRVLSVRAAEAERAAEVGLSDVAAEHQRTKVAAQLQRAYLLLWNAAPPVSDDVLEDLRRMASLRGLAGDAVFAARELEQALAEWLRLLDFDDPASVSRALSSESFDDVAVAVGNLRRIMGALEDLLADASYPRGVVGGFDD